MGVTTGEQGKKMENTDIIMKLHQLVTRIKAIIFFVF